MSYTTLPFPLSSSNPSIPGPSRHSQQLERSDEQFYIALMIKLCDNMISQPTYWCSATHLFQFPAGSEDSGLQEHEPPNEPAKGSDKMTTSHAASDLYVHCAIPSLRSSMEAYLQLEVARCDQQISLKRKELAHEILHRNCITLQLNHILLERTENDVRTAGGFVIHNERMPFSSLQAYP
ncbi:hypothetical protein OG21DRAFT_1490388 [Imleria badia]|nr:hypothetical protein OG21DRAFT_1490388 [Imleria badia]